MENQLDEFYNPNPQIKFKMPKITMNHILIIWGLITAVLVGTIIYNFWWKNFEQQIYQKGIEKGRSEINSLLIQQIQQFGAIKVNFPIDSNGDGQISENEIKPIILKPITE